MAKRAVHCISLAIQVINGIVRRVFTSFCAGRKDDEEFRCGRTVFLMSFRLLTRGTFVKGRVLRLIGGKRGE